MTIADSEVVRRALGGLAHGMYLMTSRFESKRTGLIVHSVQACAFDWLEMERLSTGARVLKGAPTVLDCEIFRHLDLEADHELYIGLVVGARLDGERVESKGALK